MNNSDQENRDQRTIPGTEDSNSMTVEFLRARLLSERSVSKSARQRADELAKRVAELEEQLRIVSRQRTKAEKATSEVLAILNSNGISDISETFDSSSDQDSLCDSKVGNKSSKEEENSVGLKLRKKESEELSGSELDFSPVSGRSLSWKGRKDSPHSLEKYNDPSLRRRSSFASIGSSSKHRPGKSCRQIRRKERSAAEEFKANAIKVYSPENVVATTSEGSPYCSDVGPEMLGETMEISKNKTSMECLPSGCLENEQNARNRFLDYNVSGRERDMEKALEHQAQLIGQYEAMEKVQRDWEEKFRENNSSTPDSCDHGNRSDVTEERYEIKAHASHPDGTTASRTHGSKSEVEDLSKIQPSHSLTPSHVDKGSLQEQKGSSPPASESATQVAFPMAVGKHKQESPSSNYQPPSQGSHQHPHSQGLQDAPRRQSSPSFPSGTPGEGKACESQNELYALVPHKAPGELGGVLDALKQARQSLQQKMKRLPLLESGSIRKAVEPSISSRIPGDKVEIPSGCVGLFRIPTDFSVEDRSRANLLSPSTRFSLGNYCPDAADNRLIASPYTETRSSSCAEDIFLSSRYVDGGSRNSIQKPYFEPPHSNTGSPSSSRNTYPHHPINPSYPTSPVNPSYPEIPHMPTTEGFSTFLPSRTVGIPYADHFSFPADHHRNTRPNMYRC